MAGKQTSVCPDGRLRPVWSAAWSAWPSPPPIFPRGAARPSRASDCRSVQQNDRPRAGQSRSAMRLLVFASVLLYSSSLPKVPIRNSRTPGQLSEHDPSSERAVSSFFWMAFHFFSSRMPSAKSVVDQRHVLRLENYAGRNASARASGDHGRPAGFSCICLRNFAACSLRISYHWRCIRWWIL